MVFVDDVAEVPAGAPLMLSAHGSPPSVVDAARARGGAVVNAVCPLVKKVHHEVKVRAGKGYTIVYVGHEGHQEAVGTAAVAPDAVHRIEHPRSWRRCPSPTGRSPSWPRPRSPSTSGRRSSTRPGRGGRTCGCPGTSDLCFATTNRQTALKAIAGALRRGGRDRLGQLVEHPGPGAHRARPPAARGCCGSTGRPSCPTTWPARSASSPGRPRPRSWCRRWSPAWPRRAAWRRCAAVDEDEYFPLPRELRDTVRQLAAAAAVAGLAPGGDPTAGGDLLPDDRERPRRWRWPASPGSSPARIA